ncbi:MAG: hypothetical protein U0Z53_11330 [Blastocatellia bacterium]
MIVSATGITASATAPHYVPQPVRILLVSDRQEHTHWLKDLLSLSGSEVTCAVSADDLSRACRERHDLAVIDAAFENLIHALRAIRASAKLSDISVLVRAERIPLEADVAGLFPKYRAMPCYHEDLLRLIRQRLNGSYARFNPLTASASAIRRARTML